MTSSLTSFALQLLPLLLNTRGKQRLSILIYHRVLPEHDRMRPDEPTISEFDWQMRVLRDNFTPLPLLEAVERLQSGSLPERAVCVTFDDGYSDNESQALPVLQKYGVPATVFVSTGFLNGGRMWNDSIIESIRNWEGEKLDLTDLELGIYKLLSMSDRVAASVKLLSAIKYYDPAVRLSIAENIESKAGRLPCDLMMTDHQIKSLANHGVSIGAHTVNHPILASVSNAVAHEEIVASKLYLENLLGEQVDVFAYPNGTPGQDYSMEHRNLVEEAGFKAAVSTHWGVSDIRSDKFQLPRFTPWDRQETKFAVRLLLNSRRIDPLVSSGA